MRLIVATGVSSGIGLALAKQLIKNKNNYVIGLSRHNTLEAENYQFQEIDLSNLNEVKAFEFPEINFREIHLVNNAGILGEIDTMGNLREEHIEDVINVNYTTPMILSNKIIHKFQDTPATKSIINISSGASTSPYPSWANYCSSKSALEMMTKCINLEQMDKEYPFFCFSIAPGVVNTSMQEKIRNTDKSKFKYRDKFVELYRNNELHSTEEVADYLEKVIENPKAFISNPIFRILLQSA